MVQVETDVTVRASPGMPTIRVYTQGEYDVIGNLPCTLEVENGTLSAIRIHFSSVPAMEGFLRRSWEALQEAVEDAQPAPVPREGSPDDDDF